MNHEESELVPAKLRHDLLKMTPTSSHSQFSQMINSLLTFSHQCDCSVQHVG